MTKYTITFTMDDYVIDFVNKYFEGHVEVKSEKNKTTMTFLGEVEYPITNDILYEWLYYLRSVIRDFKKRGILEDVLNGNKD